MRQITSFRTLFLIVVLSAARQPGVVAGADHIAEVQSRAIAAGRADFGHWGNDPTNYTQWGSHTNRLIPLFTFGTREAGTGVDLRGYTGENSPYRDRAQLVELYGRMPVGTLDSKADYCDQTNVADIQQAAFAAGKKHVFLVVFDGMDWQTIRAAAIHKTGRVGYQSGRGSGLNFQDYDANGTSQFGFMVTAPHDGFMKGNADQQTVRSPANLPLGGYNSKLGGSTPWSLASDPWYLVGKTSDSKPGPHVYPDSAATATAMTTGVKTFNGAINVDVGGQPLATIAHRMQKDGFAVGAVSSVPFSHATPAAAYAHNVARGDYQDLSRDMLGLPSVSHPTKPLTGLDVVIGGGYGVTKQRDSAQGGNFTPGNAFIAKADLAKIDVENGGRYVTAIRSDGTDGSKQLAAAADTAAKSGKRLFGFYGVGNHKGHLPFQTADGDYRPVPGRSKKAESYTKADLFENPTLAEMTEAAIRVLSTNSKGFYLLVEAGDVDWANHQNNIDDSIGAVFSGDDAVCKITDWVDEHSNWQESLLIVTADHGHYLTLTRPELLIPSDSRTSRVETEGAEPRPRSVR